MKKLFTIICFMTAFVASAQWTTNTAENTLVAESEALDMQAVGTTESQTYVVFWKNVGPPTNIELRLQILDADGNQTLGPDGILVSDQIPMSTYTVLWDVKVDAENNLYIGVTGTGGGDPAFVFKMDSEGNHMWDANGVSVGSGNKVTILPLSTGGAIVSWLSSTGAEMQKYDEAGTAVWPTSQPIELTGSFTAPGNFFEISGGDFVAVFHELLSGISSFLHAQRFDADGNPVWSDPVGLNSGTTAYNRTYTGVQDGDVIYMSYFSSASNRFDAFLQRINPDGTLPWGVNGADFDTSQANYETNIEPAFSNGSDYVWSICRYTDASQNLTGTYLQKFNKATGERLLTDSAKEIFAVGSDQVPAGRLWLKEDSPLFITNEGMNNGASPTILNSVYLDGDGNFAWPEETRPVATFSANKGRVQYTMPANNQSVAVFVEDKGDGDKIYAQNIIDGTAGVEDFTKASIFFVNPVQDEMLLKSNSPMEAVSIFNVLGQQLFNAKYNGENTVTINTQNWTSGIYFMNVSTNEGMKNGIKLIKQ